ncbi:MAG: aldehyde dehydrogenase [Gammaproteobacteria bacterium]|nr:aldehyde dehydrogenase [Gammaproteobacteria bacterium]MBU6509691.1 aldehyde dehydrogenase [Gammaproteobacteria bacterium]MDE1983661.1 aldehyde dehydrogenase [Gammaproteobacteria bacterium]
MQTISNYIDGQLVPAVSGGWLEDFEPAAGQAYARIPDSHKTDIDNAVAAARRTFPQWSATPAAERGEWLHRLATLVERDLEILARAESLDSGKPLAVARSVDIPRAAANLRFFAAAASQFASESHAMESGAINYTLRSPLGVVGCISPWNLPLYLFTWKLAPALAAGNCVVAKPSELTPMTAYLFSKLCIEAGLPAGVLNVVHGLGPKAGALLVEHPEVKAISFTGGTKTGANIASHAAPKFKKLSLELGGKNPTLVFADCDFERTVAESLRAAFSNQGEICLCGSRIFIERSLYARFRDEFVKRAQALRLGDPLDEQTEQGALVSEPHLQKVLGYLDLARKEGGKVLCGGRRANLNGRCAKGWFVEPTVIENLPPDCRTNQEEIFGPVVTLIPFDSEEQAIAWANGTPYGLAASLWSRDVSRCHRIAARLEAGLIWVNCWMLRDLRVPMGGVKQSGTGREGGWEAMRFFTEARNVCIKYE